MAKTNQGAHKYFNTLKTVFLLVILIHIIGTLFSAYVTWGVSYWNLFSAPVAFVALGTAILLIVFPIDTAISASLNLKNIRVRQVFPVTNKRFVAFIASLLLFFILFLLRSKAHVYGDGFTILGSLTSDSSTWLFDQLYLQPLAVILHRSVVEFLHGTFNLSPETAFALINCFGGVIGLWAIYYISRILAENHKEHLFLILGSLISGSVILFFGYVEYYTWATSLGLWSLYFCIKYVKGESNIWYASIFALLAIGFHAIALPYLFVVAFAYILRRWHHLWPSRRHLIYISFAMFCATAGIAAIVQYTNIENIFVLITPIANNTYWFLSVSHIIDVINLSLLVAPVGTLVFIISSVMAQNHRPSSTLESRILAFTVFLFFLVAFWVSPVIGAPRDWDLLSFFGFPFAIWAAYWLVRCTDKRSLSHGIVAITVVMIIHIGPNIMEKNNLDIATEHLDRLLWNCPQYQVDIGKASRAMVWGSLLQNELHKPERADRYFRRRIQADSTNALSWFAIGDNFCMKKQFDSAAFYLHRAVSFNPLNKEYLFKLAYAESQAENFQAAIKALQQLLTLDPYSAKAHDAAGIIYSTSGNLDSALYHYRLALKINPNLTGPPIDMGRIFSYQRKYDSAYVYLKRILRSSPRDPSLYGKLIDAQIALNRDKEALETFRILEKKFPRSNITEKYHRQLSTKIRK